MAADRLGPVSVEFFERKIDGADVQLQAGVEGSGVYAPSLPIPGATQMFVGEKDPLANISGVPGGEGVLAPAWKPWAEVWAEYEAIPLPPVPPVPFQHRRVRKRIEVQRPAPKGNFDLYLVVKRMIGGVAREIGRSELFRNCQNDLSDLSAPGRESAVWISVPSVGQEHLVPATGVLSDIEYERVRSQTKVILSDEGTTLSGLSEAAVEEVAAQSVGGLDTIGLPPDSPAKKLYDPDSNNGKTASSRRRVIARR
jgi:hypothetical protein